MFELIRNELEAIEKIQDDPDRWHMLDLFQVTWLDEVQTELEELLAAWDVKATIGHVKAYVSETRLKAYQDLASALNVSYGNAVSRVERMAIARAQVDVANAFLVWTQFTDDSNRLYLHPMGALSRNIPKKP